MTDLSVVIEKLHGFETADDLADFFRSYGIVAQPRDARSCAVSRFVASETGLVPTTNMSAITFYEDESEEFNTLSYSHTDAIRMFVDQYDRGAYPDLIEKGYEISTEKYCCEACDGY